MMSLVLSPIRASLRVVLSRAPSLRLLATACALAGLAARSAARAAAPNGHGLLLLNSGTVQVGIDRAKGGAISWLSSTVHPTNLVNIHDPGRFIQQSYYAGRSLDRTDDGQSPTWTPWPWNPIQCGSVRSWARVTQFQRLKGGILHTATIPRLWDMPHEEAAAIMEQWTSFEPGMPNVVVVHCRFKSERGEHDRWGPALNRPQEIPACYFVRCLGHAFSYLGHGAWRAEAEHLGPPWCHCDPPRKTVAMLDGDGYGVAVFSPCSDARWSFGPHGAGNSTTSTDNACVYVAPLGRAALGPHSIYDYRYWLIVGSKAQIAASADLLWHQYHSERATVISR